MKIKGTRGVITDNSLIYLQFVEDCVKHADPQAIITVDKREDRIDAVIQPSERQFKASIVYNLLEGHKLFHMKIIFSKSLALQKIITYSLYFEDL